MSTRSVIRLLQVGVGGFGANWLRTLNELADEVEIDAFVDLNQRILSAAAAEAGIPPERCFTDIDAALADSTAEMALVVVPPEGHRRVAVRCLEAGLPVLVEKPLARSREDSLALVEAARRAGLELAVSQNYRYRSAVETARRVLASGRLGRLGQAHIEFRLHHDFRGTFLDTLEQPLIRDMAIHHFDLIRFITGMEAYSVVAHSWNPPWSQFGGDASGVCVFSMETGARVVYDASWHPRGQFTDWNGRWLLECEGGYLRLDRDRVAICESDDPHRPPTPADEIEIPLVSMPRCDQAAVLTEFAAALRAGRATSTTAVDNLRSVEMVFAAADAMRTGRAVSIGTSVEATPPLPDGQPTSRLQCPAVGPGPDGSLAGTSVVEPTTPE